MNRPDYSKYYYVCSPPTVLLGCLSSFLFGVWIWEFQLRGSFFFLVIAFALFIGFGYFILSDHQVALRSE